MVVKFCDERNIGNNVEDIDEQLFEHISILNNYLNPPHSYCAPALCWTTCEASWLRVISALCKVFEYLIFFEMQLFSKQLSVKSEDYTSWI